MKRERIGQLLFLGAAVVSLALDGLTVPEGLPWNSSMRLALAHLGGCGATALAAADLPGGCALPHPVWGFYVRVFGGPVALSVSMAALAAGLIAVLVNRYFGWRFAAGAAMVWIFLPGVWYRAITGERGVCLAAMAVVALWVANAIALKVTRKARVARANRRTTPAGMTGGDVLGAPVAHGVEKKRGGVNRIAGSVALGAAGLFAVVSASLHDGKFGEAASAYARLVVDEAGERVILLNGVCDEQVIAAAGSRVPRDRHGVERSAGTRGAYPCRTLPFWNTEANRSNIVSWVKREWPGETNLWLEAEIGPASFAEAAVKAHPERFYSMMGHSTTLEKWEARWAAMKPYLASGDPFVPAMRRMFAYEGNCLANALHDRKQAWNLYYRIFTEIHPKNPAACVNLNMMLRQGYKADQSTRRRLESEQADYAKLMADRQRAKRAADWVSHFGPVMHDRKAHEELRRRLEELEKKGGWSARIPDLKTLEEWHPEMMEAFRARKYDKATRIARAILARKAWRGFVPAHMVLGEAMLMKGDLVAAESFLRTAAEATGTAAPPPFVLNDYAETLRRLGRLDEAESYARRAVEASDEKAGWFCRLTLAQVLEDGDGMPSPPGCAGVGVEKRCREEEIRSLLKSVLRHAPTGSREKIVRKFREYVR